jgi:D-xylose ABC transporter substrate-binding protein
MKNKIIYGTLFLFLALIIWSCNQPEKSEIGLLMGDLERERWKKDTTYFVKAAQQMDMKVYVRNAQNSQDNQIKQAEELIEKGVDVLVVVPVDQNLSSKIVELAHQNNIKVIAYDRLIKGCEVDYYVSFDNVMVGEKQAEYLTKLKPQGNYVLIEGPTTDNNSIMLRLGQMNVLSPYMQKGDIQIIYDQFAESWDKEAGEEEMRKCLREYGSKVDAVIAGNDALAEGIAKVIEQHGIEQDVLLAGQDAELDACQRIVKGTQTMTIYKPVRNLAEVAVKLADKFANNKGITTINNQTIFNDSIMVPTILVEPVTVNRQNIKMTVVASGFQEGNKVFTE